MINALALEISKWIAGHNGQEPSAVRVRQDVFNECIEEAKSMGLSKDKCYVGKGMRIRGIPVLVDPTLTIGNIDP